MKNLAYHIIRLIGIVGIGHVVQSIFLSKEISLLPIIFMEVSIVGYIVMEFLNKEESLKLEVQSYKDKIGEAFEPHQEDVRNACYYFRHDFGLLSPETQEEIRYTAKQWLYAWSKAKGIK